MRVVLHWAEGRAQPWIDGLRARLPQAEVLLWEGEGTCPAADYGVVWAPPQAFFDAQPGLKAVFNLGAGVDALLRVQVPPHTAVVRLEDAGMSVQMAEYVCHAVVRHFRELDAYQTEQEAGRWSFRKPRLRSEFPVGVLGLGVLGSRVATTVRQFDFPVNGWSRTPHPIDGITGFTGWDQLPAFLAASRVLVCLLPLTAETENILNREHLQQLQPGGYVINVARGRHLVDEDLLALLDSGHLAGATLDVFRQEPLPPTHPFWAHPRISVTPHTSARTLRDETLSQITGKILQLERGEPITGVVDRHRGY